MARKVNTDEVKEKVFLRGHYSANDYNFPHERPPSLWFEWVSTATMVKTRLSGGNEAGGQNARKSCKELNKLEVQLA